MRAALNLKQQDTVTLPIPIRLQPLRELHSDINADPKPPRNDENQPPVPTFKRKLPVARRTAIKRTVPTAVKGHKNKRDRVLANGISKYPVWASGKKTIGNIFDSATLDATQSEKAKFQLFTDCEAAHGSSTSSGSTGKSDGSLSGDFEDKTEPNFTWIQTKTLIRQFPITFPVTLL